LQPINGYYLYELGAQLRPLTQLHWQSTAWNVGHFPMLIARGALGTLLNNSVYQLRTCYQEGNELLTLIDELVAQMPPPQQQNELMPSLALWTIVDKAAKFETVLKAELGVTPMFYVPPRHNIDMSGYINAGHLSFPAELAVKVPEALPDAQQAARCIAFDLPTAAGFHLHRANESVLRKYFDAVAGVENRPRSRNMGDYIKKLESLGKGDAKVIAALRDLKDLHRNPLMHPEEHILSADDAIGLMGGVRQVIGLMLKVLPELSQGASDALGAIYQSAQ